MRMHCTLCENPLENKVDDFYFHCNVCDAFVKDCQFYVNSQQEKKRYEAHNNDLNDGGYQKFTSPITHFIVENYKPNQVGLDFVFGIGSVKEGCEIAHLLKDHLVSRIATIGYVLIHVEAN